MPQFESREFHGWSNDLQRRILTWMVQLRTCKRGHPRVSDETGPFDRHRGTAAEVLGALQNWVSKAGEHCAEMVRDPSLSYAGYLFNVVADEDCVTVVPALVGDGINVEGHVSLASATVVRRGESTHELYSTTDEGFGRWKSEERRIVETPLEELLASGQFLLAEDAPRGYRTLDHPGATYYDDREHSPSEGDDESTGTADPPG